jgi:hypothetical protein
MGITCLTVAACAAPAPTPQASTSPNIQKTTSQTTSNLQSSNAEASAIVAKPAPPQPSMLSGLSNDKLSRLMGIPHFQRVDDPAALWQYRTEGCVLDIYLRADGPIYRVVDFDFRPDPKKSSEVQLTPHDISACFARLAKPAHDSRG